jgi:hypothetical protein
MHSNARARPRRRCDASPQGNARALFRRNCLMWQRFACRLFQTAALALWAFAAPAWGQDLVAGIGGTRIEDPKDTSHAIVVSYSHELGPHLAASFSYLNEGHFPGHHRDGHSVQLWAHTSAFAPGFVLAAGVGPYRYFDTTVAEDADSRQFENAHGWGMQYSVAAHWLSASTPWIYEIRANRNEMRGGVRDSTQVVGAIGYRLEQDGSFRRNATTGGYAERPNELVGYAGLTIVNSFESESTHAKAASVEYRRAFGPTLRAALGYLYEGDAMLVSRNGVTAELFLEPSFYRERFTLGLGFGAYFAADEYRDSDAMRAIPLVTTTMSLRVGADWVARVSWHRIVSNYNRDSDIILVGLGYRF